MLLAQRVEETDELGAVGRVAVPIEVHRTDERVADHLVKPEPGEDATNLVARLARIGPIWRQGGVRQPAGDPLVAVGAGDLLGHVRIRGHVEPMRRHADLHLIPAAVDAESERRQQLNHSFRGDIDSQQSAGARHADAHAARLLLRCGSLSTMPRATLAPAISAMSFAARSAARPRELVPDPFLVPHARLGTEAEPPGGVADGRPVEDRRLEDHVRRGATDLGRGAAHDSGRPIARSSSAITSIPGRGCASTWSIVSSPSPSRARRTTIRPPGTASAS